jgi:predicted RNase H-like HicB family nuclease
MEYTVIVQKNPETGVYTGQCREVPEAVSQGKTRDELLENMKEAIALAEECRKADLAAMRKTGKLFFRKVNVPSRPKKMKKTGKDEKTSRILERQALMNEAEMLNKSVKKNDVTLDEIVKEVRNVRKGNKN